MNTDEMQRFLNEGVAVGSKEPETLRTDTRVPGLTVPGQTEETPAGFEQS